MAVPSHVEFVLQSSRETTIRRESTALAPDEIAPDEYPTFTRAVSPELAESKRYTHEPPRRSRTNPWSSFHRNSNSSESGDDCDRPLSRKLSRKASNVFHIFTPQRTRSNASVVPATILTEVLSGPLPDSMSEAHKVSETEEPVQPAAKIHHVTKERRKSSLKQLMDFIRGKRKDSGFSDTIYLPASPLTEGDIAMGLRQRHPQCPFTSDPDDTICMTGARPILPCRNPSTTRRYDLSSTSLNPLVNPNITESKRRKASSSSDSDEPSIGLTYGSSNVSYSTPPTPQRKHSIHYPDPAVSNSYPHYTPLARLESARSPSLDLIDMDIMVAEARGSIAPWEDAEITSPATPTIGVLPSLSSEENTSHVSLPTFVLPSKAANASTLALFTPSRPQSPTQTTKNIPADVGPASPSVDPEEMDSEKSETLAVPSPRLTQPTQALRSFTLSSSPSSDHLQVADLDTRPSTAADSIDEQGLRLRRSSSLRGEMIALESPEGMKGVESAMNLVRSNPEERECNRGRKRRRSTAVKR